MFDRIICRHCLMTVRETEPGVWLDMANDPYCWDGQKAHEPAQSTTEGSVF